MPGAELLVPLTGAEPDGLDDAPVRRLAQPQPARREVLAVDVLVLLVLGDEPAVGRHGAQDIDPQRAAASVRICRDPRLAALQLEPPDGHVEVAEHIGGEHVLAVVEAVEQLGEPPAEPFTLVGDARASIGPSAPLMSAMDRTVRKRSRSAHRANGPNASPVRRGSFCVGVADETVLVGVRGGRRHGTRRRAW